MSSGFVFLSVQSLKKWYESHGLAPRKKGKWICRRSVLCCFLICVCYYLCQIPTIVLSLNKATAALSQLLKTGSFQGLAFRDVILRCRLESLSFPLEAENADEERPQQDWKVMSLLIKRIFPNKPESQPHTSVHTDTHETLSQRFIHAAQVTSQSLFSSRC